MIKYNANRKKLAISTHKGVYQQNRLPFGVKSARPSNTEKFKCKNDTWNNRAQEDYQTTTIPEQNNTDQRSIPRRSEGIRRPPKRFESALWRRPKLKKRCVMYRC
ncbi:hypothetical protein RF11_12410 [Thelohanellus kitauei]|uniref:Uncharacterized protein n=1 Tax=Thelohanellus kitauei TaxID=669202 RepID=A0A0C2IBI9_THEKT|nr:hypothetical protein RF11_12410 [Thelohanellus kitauei]